MIKLTQGLVKIQNLPTYLAEKSWKRYWQITLDSASWYPPAYLSASLPKVKWRGCDLPVSISAILLIYMFEAMTSNTGCVGASRSYLLLTVIWGLRQYCCANFAFTVEKATVFFGGGELKIA